MRTILKAESAMCQRHREDYPSLLQLTLFACDHTPRPILVPRNCGKSVGRHARQTNISTWTLIPMGPSICIRLESGEMGEREVHNGGG